MAYVISEIHFLLVLQIVSANINGRKVVDLDLDVYTKESKYYNIQLNCSTSEKPIPIATFLLNNSSLANIGFSKTKCLIRQRECKKEECECGKHFFFYNFTTNLKQGQHVFTCELRFNEEKAGIVLQSSVQSSVLYNKSGIYKLGEITEEKGIVTSHGTIDKNENEDGGSYVVPVVSTLVLVLLTVIVVVSCCYAKKKQAKRQAQHERKRSHTCFTDVTSDHELQNMIKNNQTINGVNQEQGRPSEDN